MKLRVQCYSGYKAEERPVRFSIDDHEYVVDEVLDQWYGPEYAWYKVRADDGNIYSLNGTRLNQAEGGIWSRSGKLWAKSKAQFNSASIRPAASNRRVPAQCPKR